MILFIRALDFDLLVLFADEISELDLDSIGNNFLPLGITLEIRWRRIRPQTIMKGLFLNNHCNQLIILFLENNVFLLLYFPPHLGNELLDKVVFLVSK